MAVLHMNIPLLIMLMITWLEPADTTDANILDNEIINCGENFNALHGHFNTPNYPEVYPDSLDCRWNITVPEGYEILLNFTQFELEWTDYCKFDYVTVESTNGSLGKFCGRRSEKAIPRVTVPPLEPIKIPDNALQIFLHTDFSNDVEVHGFQAHFAATDVDECAVDNGGCSQFCHNFIGSYYCSCRIGYLLQKDRKNCRVLCHNIYPQKHNGVIASPEYPNDYPPNAACDWHITAEKGYFVNLEFLDFDVEKHEESLCPYDYLSIEDQNEKHGPYCGKTLPPKIRSRSNWLIIEFFTDQELGFKGFKARYWLESIKCPRLSEPSHGYMTGPRNFTFKETLQFSCKEDYYLNGSSSRTCQANGTWSGTEAICSRIICPDYLDARANEYEKIPANVWVYGGKSVEPNYFGDELYFGCSKFWLDILGTKVIKCQRDQTWSRVDAVECVRTCGRDIRSYSGKTNRAIEQCNTGRHRSIATTYSQPWLVAIKSKGKVICSGILISDQWVITSTHCIKNSEERRGLPGTLEIILGTDDWRKSDKYTVVSKVKQVVVHQKFDYVTHSDIALLKMSTKVSRDNEYIQSICLGHDKNHRNIFRGGDKHIASIGWYTSGESYKTDRCVRIEKNREKCRNHTLKTHLRIHKEKYGNENGRKQFPPTDIMCTYPTVGESDNCKILPGSALVAYDDKLGKWYLGGILTWGSNDVNDCKKYMHDYTVYTKVMKYRTWIKYATGLKPRDLDASSAHEKWASSSG